MAVGKRKAPKKENGKRLAAALKGPDSLRTFSREDLQRHEHERLAFLQGVATDLGLERERFGSNLVWLFELAYRLASDQFASTGSRGRPSELTSDDLKLWTLFITLKRKGFTEREIALSLVAVKPWAKQFEDKLKANEEKKPKDRLTRNDLKEQAADNLRKRFRRIAGLIEKIKVGTNT